MASFFIRQFVRREGSGRPSQRECVTNEITVWLHVAVARSLFITAFKCPHPQPGFDIRTEPDCSFELHPVVNNRAGEAEAAMLKRTPPEALQEAQERGIRRFIRTFDPDVPGYVFWPIIFGVGVIFAVVVLRGF